MQITIEEIGPDKAAEWLTKNALNRNIRRAHVDALARDMKAGRWKLTGQAVQFDTNDKLKDGQHRLTAIVESGCTITSAVAYGVEPDAQSVMDVGRSRTYSDKLKLQGEANPALLAAVLRLMVVYERGQWTYKDAYTFGEMDECLERNPDLREAVSVVGSDLRRKLRGFRPAVLTLVWYVTKLADLTGPQKTDGNDHEAFWKQAKDGLGLVDGSAVYALRRLNERQIEGTTQARSAHIQYGLIVKAWNAYREGRPVQVLMFRPGGATPEKTPSPI